MPNFPYNVANSIATRVCKAQNCKLEIGKMTSLVEENHVHTFKLCIKSNIVVQGKKCAQEKLLSKRIVTGNSSKNLKIQENHMSVNKNKFSSALMGKKHDKDPCWQI